MADDSRKPAVRGKTSRLTVAGRLTALVGLPLLTVASIFASGLYVGATRSYRIQTLEAAWLGLAPSPGFATTEANSPGGASRAPIHVADAGTGDAGRDGAGTDAGSGGAGRDGASAVEDVVDPGGEPAPEGELGQPGGDPATKTTTGPDAATEPARDAGPEGVAVATADPVGPELRARFDEPLTIRVKIVVDPSLAVSRDDWLSYVDQMFANVRTSFEVLAGVELRLNGVVLWDADADADVPALLSDLKRRERDGADVILGLVARPEPELADSSSWTDAQNGDHALVFADLGRRDRYYQGTLRALAGLLGAEPPIGTEPAQVASFMSPAAPDSTPTLDPENRGKIIINKRRPFADSRAPTEAERDVEADTDTGADNDTPPDDEEKI